MKWITCEYVKVDRVACPWLIKKFVDKDAEFILAPADKVMDEAKRLDATPYDVKNVNSATTGKSAPSRPSSRNTILRMIRRSCFSGKSSMGPTRTTRSTINRKGQASKRSPKAFGILATRNDHEVNAAEWIVYDALYAYCKKMVQDGKPNGDFK